MSSLQWTSEIQRKMCLSIFGGFFLIALVLVAHFHDVSSQSQSNAINEICNVYNGRRIYLDLGEHGVLKASNIAVPGNTNVNILMSITRYNCCRITSMDFRKFIIWLIWIICCVYEQSGVWCDKANGLCHNCHTINYFYYSELRQIIILKRKTGRGAQLCTEKIQTEKIDRYRDHFFFFIAEISKNWTNGKWQHRHSSPVSTWINYLSIVHFPIDTYVSFCSSCVVFALQSEIT